MVICRYHLPELSAAAIRIRRRKHFLDKAKITLVPLIRIHRQDKGVLNTGLRALQKVCVAAAPLWLLMVHWTWLVDATVATLRLSTPRLIPMLHCWI